MSTTLLMLLLMFSPAFVWQTQSKDDSGPLKPYTTGSPADDLKLRNSTHFKYPGNHREVSIIDVGEVVGTHVLFDDAKYLIITVYFLNQQKKSQIRRFSQYRGVSVI